MKKHTQWYVAALAIGLAAFGCGKKPLPVVQKTQSTGQVLFKDGGYELLRVIDEEQGQVIYIWDRGGCAVAPLKK